MISAAPKQKWGMCSILRAIWARQPYVRPAAWISNSRSTERPLTPDSIRRTGVHAIAIAADAVSRLTFGHTDPITTVNIGMINGGLMKNIIPESCELYGEIRSYEEARVVEEYNHILDVFNEAAERRGGSVSTWNKWRYKALDTPEDSAVVRYYLKACAKDRAARKACRHLRHERLQPLPAERDRGHSCFFGNVELPFYGRIYDGRCALQPYRACHSAYDGQGRVISVSYGAAALKHIKKRSVDRSRLI